MKWFLFTLALFCFLLPVSDVYAQVTDKAEGTDSICRKTPKVQVRHPWGTYGLSLSAGISRVVDSDFPLEEGDTTVTCPFKPSAKLGFYYNFYFGEYFLLTLEPCFSVIQGTARMDYSISGLNYVDEYRKQLYFMSLPITCGLNFKRFVIDIGIQPSFQLYGRTQINKVYISTTGNVPRGNSDYKAISSHPFDLGAKGEVSYNIYKRLSLFISIYWGLMDISRPEAYEPDPPTWYIRQFTFGVKCPFNKVNKNTPLSELHYLPRYRDV